MFKNSVLKASVNTKEWAKKAAIRAVKTMAQTAVAVIGTSTVVAAVDWKIVVSSAVVSGVVSKGLLRNFAVCFRITDFDDVSGLIVGDVGRVPVFVGDFRRFVEAVIDFDDGIASRVGLFYDVEPLVIGIGFGIAVFIRMADQKPVLIENADTLMAAAVGGDSLSVAFVYEDGRNGAGNAVSLADDPAACVIGVVEIADFF